MNGVKENNTALNETDAGRRAFRRRRAIRTFFLAGGALAGLGVVTYTLRTTAETVTLADRAQMEWSATATTLDALKRKPQLANSGVAAFVSTKVLNGGLGVVKGTTFRAAPADQADEDAQLTIDDIRVTTRPGTAAVTVAVTATSAKRDVTATLSVEGFIYIKSFTPSAGDATEGEAVFGLHLTRVQPGVRWGWFNAGADDLTAKVIALGIQTKLEEMLTHKVPVTDRIRTTFAMDESSTMDIKGKGDAVVGTITLKATAPAANIDTRLGYSAPIFMENGIWLTFDEGTQGAAFEAPTAPAESAEQLQARTEAMQAQIREAAKGYDSRGADLAAYINGGLLTRAFSQFGSLNDAQRTVSIQSTSVTGKLYNDEWSDDVLGDGGFYVELTGNEAFRGSLAFGSPQAAFVPGSGLKVSLGTSGQADVAVHMHMDPLIGGGVGTSVGLKGSFSHAFDAQTTLRTVDVGGHQVVAFVTTVKDASPRLTMATDGVFKTDFGWTKVPSIGATMAYDIAPDGFAPAPIVDDVSHRYVQKDTDTVDWAANTVDVRATPKAVETTDDGFFIGLGVDIKTSDKVEDAHAFDAERAGVAKAVADMRFKDPASTKDSFFAVNIGPYEFGPGNELVKFFIGIGKLAEKFRAVAERMGAELTPAKVAEWTRDPEGSWERGDLQRFVPGIGQNENGGVTVTAPVPVPVLGVPVPVPVTVSTGGSNGGAGVSGSIAGHDFSF